MAKQLTEKQQLFLECLFLPEVKGSFSKAKKLAGYSENTPVSGIIDGLREEILEYSKRFILANAPKAVMSISSILDNPTDLGSKEILAAAKDILDRAGIVKTEKIEVQTPGIFILPKKDD